MSNEDAELDPEVFQKLPRWAQILAKLIKESKSGEQERGAKA